MILLRIHGLIFLEFDVVFHRFSYTVLVNFVFSPATCGRRGEKIFTRSIYSRVQW